MSACSPPGSPGGSSDGGVTSTPGTGTSDSAEDTTMVEQLAAEHPFDALTVARAADGPLTSWDLTFSRGGAPMLRYRIQGEWDGQAPQVDGYQRLEEATALEGAPTLAGEVIVPRSNWEFAFQLVVDGDAQFVPYHGVPTAFAVGETVVRLDGDDTRPGSLEIGRAVEVEDFALTQTVRARHPRRPDEDLVEITTTTTWQSDGRGRIEGTWRALADVEMGTAYGPMLPFSRDVFDRVITDTGGDIAVEDDASEETVPIANTTSAQLRSSEHGWSAAITWRDPGETLRAEAAGDGGTDVFLQLRDDGIGKIYPQVWDLGDAVAAGTAWDFEAEWIVCAP